jgi:hypothetical protein
VKLIARTSALLVMEALDATMRSTEEGETATSQHARGLANQKFLVKHVLQHFETRDDIE